MGTYGAQYVCTLGKLCHEVLLNLLSDAGSNGRSGELAITKWSSEDPFRIIKVFLESFETNKKVLPQYVCTLVMGKNGKLCLKVPIHSLSDAGRAL